MFFKKKKITIKKRHLKTKLPKWNLCFSLDLLLLCSITHKTFLYPLRSSGFTGFSNIPQQSISKSCWYYLKSAPNASNILEHFLNLNISSWMFLITPQLSSSLSYQYTSTWLNCLLFHFPCKANILILLRHSTLPTTPQWLLSQRIKSKVLIILTRPCHLALAASLTSSPTLFRLITAFHLY